jgi:ribosomal protein L9
MSNMFLNIVSTFKNDGIAAATRQLGAFGSQAGSLGSTLGKVGGALASFGIAAKAVQFTSQSIDSARDLERNMYSLNTVFGNLSPQMEQFTKDAHEIGLSQKDAAKSSVFLGSVLKQSGFSMADTAKETKKLVELGTDLAVTYGYDVQEALLGMTALFRGEYDPIEKFGVAMKQSEINAELAARGQDNLTGAARRNAEQIIRMELLYQRASDAMGAFRDQEGNLFVEQAKLQAQFENMQASIGTQLLPVMVGLTEALLPLINYLGPLIGQAIEGSIPILESMVSFIADLSDKSTLAGGSLDFLIGAVGATVDATAGLLEQIGPLALLIGGVTAAVYLLGAALTFINAHPVVATLTALAAAFIWINETNKNLQYEVDATGASVTSFNGTLNASATASQYVADKYGVAATAARDLTSAVNNIPDVKLEANFRNNQMKDYLRFLGGKAKPATPASSAPQPSAGGGGGLTQAQKDAQKAQEEAAKEAERQEKEREKEEADRLKRREDAYKRFTEAVQQTFSQLKESVMSAFNLPELGNSVNSITRNIQKLLKTTRSFSANITKLGELGLNADLLDQVIQAGPVEGAKLAQSLVSGGAGFIGNLNKDYAEFEGLASSIAGVGTRQRFGDAQTVNNYSVNVTGGIATSADVGRTVVNAIRDFERQSGAAWRA